MDAIYEDEEDLGRHRFGKRNQEFGLLGVCIFAIPVGHSNGVSHGPQIELQDQRSRENSGIITVYMVLNAWRSVSLSGKTTGCRSEDRGEVLGPTLGTRNI